MNSFRKYFVIFFCLVVFLAAPFFCSAQQYSPDRVFYLSRENEAKGLESLNENWDQIDILAPQFFVVNAKLEVEGSLGSNLEQIIKKHNMKVMPLVINDRFNQIIMHNLLNSESAQDKVINYLIKGALTNGYIGWQFDFENISYKDKDLYTAFVQKAYPLFKENNLIFSVTVVSRTVDYENTNIFKNWSGVFDYEKLSESCDFITLMAYDDPNSAGPTASLDFVNNVLNYAKDKIPAKKLSLGVPLYYWQWNAPNNKRLGFGLFQNIWSFVSDLPHVLTFDPSVGVSCLTYSYDNKNYNVWLEDENSFEKKVSIVKDNQLRGFSAWVLGGEDPAIWNILGKTK